MLQYNARWAAKLEKQRRMEEERQAAERAEEERKKEQDRVNPFVAGQASGGLFGGGSLFDAPPPPAAAAAAPARPPSPDYDEEERLAEELAVKASVAEQQRIGGQSWAVSTPAYTAPEYLGTIPEPVEEQAPAPVPATTAAPTADPSEKYENTLLQGIDGTFEHFMRRIRPEPRQVVRYEFGGVPLPFSAAGALSRALWPGGTYSAAAVPPCACGAPRVFELQLMPNLANILRRESLEGMPGAAASSEEARRREVESLLGVSDAPDDRSAAPSGIAWATAHVFVCSADCVREREEGWREEYVGVQFDGDI